MTDYSKGKIYQIRCNITGDCYIGSTVQTLSERMYGHVYDYNAKEVRNNCSSCQIIQRGDYEITLLQLFPCNNKSELHWRERYYQENTTQCINVKSAIRTANEKKEYDKKKSKKHYAVNRVQTLARMREYYHKKKQAATDPNSDNEDI